MRQLVEITERVENTFDMRLEWISGVNSSGLDLISAGLMPERINHARMGESIQLGRETTCRRAWPGTSQEAFLLHAEVLEVKKTASLPVGERAQDAFGRLPDFDDHGDRVRALLSVGRADVDVEGVTPHDAGILIVGASSGYLVVDVAEATRLIQVGDELVFSLTYGALLAASTSEYVKKRPLREGVPLNGEL